jgi:calcium-dependent protein kinase
LDKRLSAQDALNHPWIKTLAPDNCLINNYTNNLLDNMKAFKADEKLLEATLAFITNQLATKDEIADIKKMFLDLDVNHDGILSYQEIVEVYKKIYKKPDAEEEAKEIFNNIDSDNNGFITYDEFIRGCVDKKRMFTEDRLKQAFSMFDKNGDGSISAKEIRMVLERDQSINKNVWEEIIKEVDINGDGEISLEEFKAMMMKIIC